MAYKLTNSTSIIRLSDQAIIPADSGNRDYAAYLTWVSQGNTADAADLPFEQTWDGVRAKRSSLLSSCDWTQLEDSPLSGPSKQAWADYRTELREIPQTYENVEDIVWPTEPS